MLEGKTKTPNDVSTSNTYEGCGRHNRGCNATFLAVLTARESGASCDMGYAGRLDSAPAWCLQLPGRD